MKPVRSLKKKQNGSGFWAELFNLGDNKNKLSRSGRNSSYDEEVPEYHLTPEQKKLREKEMRERVMYSTVVNSENNLINTYEALARASRQYYKSYNAHLGNLITLDESLGIHGFENTFKNIVIKNEFKGNDRIDRSNPLLLRNFLVSDVTLPRNFRKEHLLSQIRYVLRKFNPKDELLIQSIDIELEGNKALVKLRTLNGDLHERTISVDKDFNLDMTELKRNMKDILVAIKRKMDFEIEIVDDFDLGSEDIEVPGLMFMDEENALERRLKDMEMRKTIRADGPVPLSQMSKKGSNKKSKSYQKIFGVSEPKEKYKPIEIPIGPIIPGEQGFGEGRQLDKKPFELEENLAKIFEGGPSALLQQPVQPAQPGMMPQQPGMMPQQPGMMPQQPGMMPQQPGMMPQQPGGINTRDELEKKCNALSNDEQLCRNTMGCFYNKAFKKCHKDNKI